MEDLDSSFTFRVVGAQSNTATHTHPFSPPPPPPSPPRRRTTKLTNHGEDVGVVDGALLVVVLGLLAVEDTGHGQTEVRSEHMHVH